MPATVDATMLVATTSRIIPPIMNEFLIFTPHFATCSWREHGREWLTDRIGVSAQRAGIAGRAHQVDKH
jgi:hypothetical protein